MRTSLKLIVAGLGFAASASAISAPLYSSFDIEVRSGFTAFDPAGAAPQVVGSNPITLFSGPDAPQTLSWGVPANDADAQSSLVVQGIPGFNILTDGFLTPSGSIVHNNFPIFAPSLETATLSSEISITAMPGAVGPVIDAIGLNINFIETANAGNALGMCAGGGQTGVGINDNGCADIFVVDVTGAGFNAAGQIVRELGGLGDPDYLYTATIAIAGALPLSSEACQAAAGVDNCVGFLTREDDTSRATTFIGIASREAPVPAPAPILGLGLEIGRAHV